VLDVITPLMGLTAALLELGFGLVLLALRLAGAALGVAGEVAWLILVWAARHPALAVLTALAGLAAVAVVL
jgi:hypothetical protein